MNLDELDIQTLIISDILGTITTKEKDQLNRLMAESSEVRDQYEYIKKELASEEAQPAKEGYATASQIINIAERRKRNRIIRYAIAASVIGVLGGLAYYMLTLGVPKKNEMAMLQPSNTVTLALGGKNIDLESGSSEISANGFVLHTDNKTLTYTGTGDMQTASTLTVPAGKDYKVVLDDGTVIFLNSASTLKFPMKFKGDTREVSITGEAYLQVAPNSSHHFTVHLPNSDVQVLGTEFNVNTYDNGDEKVSLVKGSVKMNAKGNSVILKPGNAADFAGKDITVNSFKQEEVIGWKEGLFIFPDGITVDEIARVMPRYSNLTLVIDPSASGKKFKGIVFDRNKPIDDLLFQLTATKVITSYKKEGVIHLK